VDRFQPHYRQGFAARPHAQTALVSMTARMSAVAENALTDWFPATSARVGPYGSTTCTEGSNVFLPARQSELQRINSFIFDQMREFSPFVAILARQTALQRMDCGERRLAPSALFL
jgi:hypothetical protein